LPNSCLLDTHAWVWLIQDSPKLSEDTYSLLATLQARRCLFVSVFSVWEIALLVRRGKLKLQQPVQEWVDASMTDGGIQILPLTPQISIESVNLPGEMHRDPADRILVATCRVHELTLLTHDKPLLQYAKQGHLRAKRI
jgi:PIN domain nuclease of toxin-antitoxin system